MTKVTIDRELLERLETWVTDDCEALHELQAILAATRQPEGEGLEVVAMLCEDVSEFGTVEYFDVFKHIEPGTKLYTSDHQRAIAELREECERLRMQLAACGVVALANTPESASEARQMHPDYMSASCSDVADAVDREIALRQQLAERDAQIASMRAEVTPFIETHWRPVERQRDKLADLLADVKADYTNAIYWEDMHAVMKRIDAALAEIEG